MMTRGLAGALVVAIMLTGGLTGCAPDDTDEWLIRIEDNGTTRALAVPGTVDVEVGDEVRWNNIGSRTHEVTGGLAGGDLSSTEDVEIVWGPERLGPGETLAHRFEQAGVYLFWFDDDGTFGTILVGPQS